MIGSYIYAESNYTLGFDLGDLERSQSGHSHFKGACQGAELGHMCYYYTNKLPFAYGTLLVVVQHTLGGGEGSVPTVVSIGVLPTAALKQLIGIYSLIPTTLSLYT